MQCEVCIILSHKNLTKMQRFIFLAVVLLFLFLPSYNNLDIIVQPNGPSTDSHCHCLTRESDSVHIFDYYIKYLKNANESEIYGFANGADLNFTFLCGQHTIAVDSTSTYTQVNLSLLQSLTIKGNNSDPGCVVVHNVALAFESVPHLQLQDITIRDVTFIVYPPTLRETAFFNIVNCNFIRSNCLIIGSEVTIQDSMIINGTNTAVNLVSSSLRLEGNVTFMGNSGEKGGALALTSTKMNISRNADITFSGNTAKGKGGAIHVNNPTEVLKVFPDSDCFYQLLDYDENASYSLTFKDNSATFGGSHIFGHSLKSHCTAAKNNQGKIASYELIKYHNDSSQTVFNFENPGLSDNPIDSAVAASPARVCICDKNKTPQCLDHSRIFISNIIVYPGELFKMGVAVVGGDFGSTIGTVQLSMVNSNKITHYLNCSEKSRSEMEARSSDCFSVVSAKNCTELQFAIHSNNTSELLSLTALRSNLLRVQDQMNSYKDSINASINTYETEGVIESALIFTPVFITVTLKPCPLGFHFEEDRQACDCYSPMRKAYRNIKCTLKNNTGYLSLSDNNWIGDSSINKQEVGVSQICHACDKANLTVQVDVLNPTSIDAQCAFNHAGRLCGGCRAGYSLAIGSSHCIKCYNDNNLSLLIFFAVAGILVVMFITSVNLTVTQGFINGVIFYANIVWVYESIIFPSHVNGVLLFLETFIAWLNLDFGIETCFVMGLDAFWKTLLQYLFPLYIWSIVGVIILAARYSMRLTKFLGSRMVSVLSTLTLLSYMKLLRTVTVSLEYATLDYFNEDEKIRSVKVWLADGQWDYCKSRHIFVFLAALIIVFLFVPFTLMLLLSRWLRKVPCLTRFLPIFDSYFAPIKFKHQYWPGVLLIARAFLYLMKIVLFEHQATFALLITIVLLLSFTSVVYPYRSRIVFLLHCAFLANLIILSGGILYVNDTSTDSSMKGLQPVRAHNITVTAILIAFGEFCVIVILSVVKSIPYTKIHSYLRKAKYRQTLRRKGRTVTSKTTGYESSLVSYTTLRDSILEELPE